jgi:hypothetical protein
MIWTASWQPQRRPLTMPGAIQARKARVGLVVTDSGALAVASGRSTRRQGDKGWSLFGWHSTQPETPYQRLINGRMRPYDEKLARNSVMTIRLSKRWLEKIKHYGLRPKAWSKDGQRRPPCFAAGSASYGNRVLLPGISKTHPIIQRKAPILPFLAIHMDRLDFMKRKRWEEHGTIMPRLHSQALITFPKRQRPTRELFGGSIYISKRA